MVGALTGAKRPTIVAAQSTQLWFLRRRDFMRKASIIISVCAVVAVTVTLYGQMRDLDPIMKEVGPTFNGLTAGMRGRAMPAADVARDAEKLQNLFKEVSAFMHGKNLEKAVGWANEAANAAAELSKAAKANEVDPMKTAQGNIQKMCKTCHEVHREQLPDKSFKMKTP